MLHRTPGQVTGIPGAVRASTLIHTSGTVDPDALAGAVRTAAQQARAALAAVLHAVEGAGGSAATVMHINAVLSSRDHAHAWEEAFRKHWPTADRAPARTTIVAELLDPGLLVELQAVATLHQPAPSVTGE